MNGPEHYRRAEELLADITDTDGSVDFGDGGEAFVAAAQVHATLALAAATALSAPDYALPVLDGNRWFDVAGTKAAGNVDVVEVQETVHDGDMYAEQHDDADKGPW